MLGQGVYFTKNYEYAKNRSASNLEEGNGEIFSCFLNIRKIHNFGSYKINSAFIDDYRYRLDNKISRAVVDSNTSDKIFTGEQDEDSINAENYTQIVVRDEQNIMMAPTSILKN